MKPKKILSGRIKRTVRRASVLALASELSRLNRRKKINPRLFAKRDYRSRALSHMVRAAKSDDAALRILSHESQKIAREEREVGGPYLPSALVVKRIAVAARYAARRREKYFKKPAK